MVWDIIEEFHAFPNKNQVTPSQLYVDPSQSFPDREYSANPTTSLAQFATFQHLLNRILHSQQ